MQGDTALCEGSAYNGMESPTVLVVITPSALRRHEDTLSGNKMRGRYRSEIYRSPVTTWHDSYDDARAEARGDGR